MNRLTVGVAAALLIGFGAHRSSADVLLPDPTSTVDGIPTALLFHDVYSYSAGLLDAWQQGGYLPGNTSEFLFSTGTGTIAILPYTGAGGATNPAPFAAPLDAPGGGATTFSGVWNNDLVANAGTVGALLSFLQSSDPNNTVPVFYFDNNQNVNKDLFAYGYAQIIAPDGTVLHTSCFDGNTSGDCTAPGYVPVPVLVPGEISVTGIDSVTFTVNTNSGSGKPDFFLLDPTLDLSQFDPNSIIAIGINFSNLSGGFEELGIFGATVEATPVPEPSSLPILGAGLAALALWFRRKRFFNEA
jgi:hypothetical protein